jgi:hypothetical protein
MPRAKKRKPVEPKEIVYKPGIQRNIHFGDDARMQLAISGLRELEQERQLGLGAVVRQMLIQLMEGSLEFDPTHFRFSAPASPLIPVQRQDSSKDIREMASKIDQLLLLIQEGKIKLPHGAPLVEASQSHPAGFDLNEDAGSAVDDILGI